MTERIVVTDKSFPSLDIEREVLADADVELEAAHASTESEVIDAIEGASAILTHHSPITRRVLESTDDLRVVGRYGTGVDTVDLDAATEHGVQVVNVVSYCEDEVATHAFALLLSVVRRTPQYDAEIKDGTWD